MTGSDYRHVLRSIDLYWGSSPFVASKLWERYWLLCDVERAYARKARRCMRSDAAWSWSRHRHYMEKLDVVRKQRQAMSHRIDVFWGATRERHHFGKPLLAVTVQRSNELLDGND